MAVVNQILHRKNDSGSYDTVYLKSNLTNVTGTLALTNGGTGATDAASARSNLGAMSSSGGAFSGNISVGSSTIGTNGYIQGTWLQTTAATDNKGNFATLSNGWIYYRTPTEVRGDIGAAEFLISSSQPTNQLVGDFWCETV